MVAVTESLSTDPCVNVKKLKVSNMPKSSLLTKLEFGTELHYFSKLQMHPQRVNLFCIMSLSTGYGCNDHYWVV